MSTYSQIYIHIVFAVKYRRALICPEWEDELYKYISGIINGKKHRLLAINGMPDHIHIFINFNPELSLSDLVREIKKASNVFINMMIKPPHKFRWQNGYGAFSYARSNIGNVIRYIQNQKEHHKKKSFKDEYISLLTRFQVDYKEEYLFEWLDDD